LWVRNYGAARADSVYGTLSTDDPVATVLDSVCWFGDVPGLDSVSTGPVGFRFEVSPACTSGHLVRMSLRCEDAADSVWVSSLVFRVVQPRLELLGLVVNDSGPGGNRNGRLDPLEDAKLWVTLRNAGLAQADDVVLTLVCPDPGLVVTDSVCYVGTIPIRDTVDNHSDPFEVSAQWMVPESKVSCTLRVSAAGYSLEIPIVLEVGSRAPSDPIPDGPRQPAVYWAYDDVDSLYTQRPVFEWIEIAGVGAPLHLGDDQTVGIDLPPWFGPFVFYGKQSHRIWVCSNGWIAFDTTAATTGSNGSLPSVYLPGAVAANWDNLHPEDGGEIWWLHDTARHCLIVEWDSVPRNVQYCYRFQVLLFDTTRAAMDGNCDIVVQYRAVYHGGSTVGIQDSAAAVAIEVVYNSRYERGAAPIVPGRAIRFTTEQPVLGVSGEDRAAMLSLPGLFMTAGPNPAGRSVRVSWLLPSAGRMELAVFDVAGRRVRTLASGVRPAGPHDIAWNGRDDAGRHISNGVYLLRLTAGQLEVVRKIVIQK
jgi:hypothetical protein